MQGILQSVDQASLTTTSGIPDNNIEQPQPTRPADHRKPALLNRPFMVLVIETSYMARLVQWFTAILKEQIFRQTALKHSPKFI
jgi:hypothetical protein